MTRFGLVKSYSDRLPAAMVDNYKSAQRSGVRASKFNPPANQRAAVPKTTAHHHHHSGETLEQLREQASFHREEAAREATAMQKFLNKLGASGKQARNSGRGR